LKPASATIEPVAVKLEAAGLILSPTELIDPVAVKLETPLAVRSASALIDPVLKPVVFYQPDLIVFLWHYS
jgi:hypothetical protein